jgi:Polyketide cyclase / dehydrase and lipid transport
MKYLMWAFAGALVVAGFIWLCGYLLPPKHEASASLKLKASPEAVWAVLTAVENYPDWRSDVAISEVISSAPELSWKESDSKGRVMVHAAGPGRNAEKWIDKLVRGDRQQGGERVFLIVADAEGGSRVAVTEDVELRDPLARFRARFMTGYAENLKKLLEDLRKRLAE